MAAGGRGSGLGVVVATTTRTSVRRTSSTSQTISGAPATKPSPMLSAPSSRSSWTTTSARRATHDRRPAHVGVDRRRLPDQEADAMSNRWFDEDDIPIFIAIIIVMAIMGGACGARTSHVYGPGDRPCQDPREVA